MRNSASSSSKLGETVKNNSYEMSTLSKNKKTINDLPIEVLATIFQYLSIINQHELAKTSKENRSVLLNYPHLLIYGLANSDDAMIKRALTRNPNIKQIEQEKVTTVPLLTLAKKHRKLLEHKRVDFTKIEHQQTLQAYTRKLFPLIKGSWEQAERAITAMVKLPGNRIATSSRDHDTIKILDSRTGALLYTLTHGYGETVSALEALPPGPDGKAYLAGSSRSSLSIWDPTTGILIRSYILVGSLFRTLPADSNGNILLANAFGAGMIKIYDLAAAQRIGGSAFHSFSSPVRTLNANMNWLGGVSALHAFSSREDAKVLLANGTSSNGIKIWNPLTGALVHTLHGHESLVISLQDFPSLENGKVLLASGSRDKSIKIWDPHAGTLLNTLQGHTGWVKALKVLPHGINGEIMLASGSLDNTIKIWNTRTGECLKTIPTAAPVWSLMYDEGVLRAGLQNGQIVSIHSKGVDLDAVLGSDNSPSRMPLSSAGPLLARNN